MRIAIAAGQRTTVEALRRAVIEASGHDIVWTTRDGADAIGRCRAEPPDLLLLDLDVAGLGGVEVTRRVMSEAPCAILVVSPPRGSAGGGAVGNVYEAMGHGALDVVNAPVLDLEGELTGAGPLLARVARVEKLVAPRPAPLTDAPEPGEVIPLVAVGASTGGPQALASILEKLPHSLQAGLVLVQHIEEGFASGLASWLKERTSFPVEIARAGDAPRRGAALLAATGDHLVMAADRRLHYTSEPAGLVHRPSADVFFASLAVHATPGLAVLLTGMGRDGADGLLRLRRAGWSTIAQDEETSIVYGMPKAAAELGAAEQILPLEGIPATIAAFASRSSRLS